MRQKIYSNNFIGKNILKLIYYYVILANMTIHFILFPPQQISFINILYNIKLH